MKVTEFKRLVTEDFDAKDRGVVEKLARVLNPVIEQMASALNKNLTFADNIAAPIKDFDVMVNSSGVPKVSTAFKTGLSANIKGLFVIKAENLTNPAVSPTSQPFVTYTESDGLVYVSKITGLQADNKYRLRVIVVG
jgi:hypothetical protein